MSSSELALPLGAIPAARAASVSREAAASWNDDNADTSWPSSTYVPSVGASRQPRMCISVDLPEPDGPLMATNSFCSIRIETSRRASTSSDPLA